MTSKNNGSETSTSTTVLPQPQRLSVGETDTGLVTVEIQLRKFKMAVVEADGFSRFKLNSLITETLKELGDPPEDYEGKVRVNMITQVWCPLKACSTGEVPTYEQFLAMPKGDIAFWVETAKGLGHEFAWLDSLNRIYDQEVELAETKKKGKRPKESIKDS
jgi:hypothetical protein